MISLFTPSLLLSAILFCVGIAGLVLNRRNLIVMLMAIELMLLAANINFVAFSAHTGDLRGQVFALIVLAVAAAEAAIGLALMVVFFRNRATITLEAAQTLRDDGVRDDAAGESWDTKIVESST